MRGPTLNHEPNIGRPYASRDRYHELLPVPYGDAGGTKEQLTAAPQISEDDVHAEHNQERRSGKGQVPKELKMERRRQKKHREMFISRTEHNGGEARRTHELEDVLDLKTWLVRMRVHMG